MGFCRAGKIKVVGPYAVNTRPGVNELSYSYGIGSLGKGPALTFVFTFINHSPFMVLESEEFEANVPNFQHSATEYRFEGGRRFDPDYLHFLTLAALPSSQQDSNRPTSFESCLRH